jgi:F420-non-reducing hydrogenase iron-sulfur subunit
MGTGDTRGEPPAQPGGRQLNIIAFCCHYCAYGAADLAGALRLQHPASVHVVKLPCTGKLDVLLVLGAIEKGADGVMVAGCLEGDCHYQNGNLNAKRRVGYVQTLLKEIGLEPERVRMFNMSSAMGQRWADAVSAMDEQIWALGPSPLRHAPAEPATVALEPVPGPLEPAMEH